MTQMSALQNRAILDNRCSGTVRRATYSSDVPMEFGHPWLKTGRTTLARIQGCGIVYPHRTRLTRVQWLIAHPLKLICLPEDLSWRDVSDTLPGLTSLPHSHLLDKKKISYTNPLTTPSHEGYFFLGFSFLFLTHIYD